LYLKVDVECIGRVQNWILERQKLSWLSFFFLWDLLCFVRYGAEECLCGHHDLWALGVGDCSFFFWSFFETISFLFVPSFLAGVSRHQLEQKRPCISQKAIWLFLHSATTL
jgi:hypothetical protein